MDTMVEEIRRRQTAKRGAALERYRQALAVDDVDAAEAEMERLGLSPDDLLQHRHARSERANALAQVLSDEQAEALKEKRDAELSRIRGEFKAAARKWVDALPDHEMFKRPRVPVLYDGSPVQDEAWEKAWIVATLDYTNALKASEDAARKAAAIKAAHPLAFGDD